MSLAAHLLHTCTIQRATVTTDGYGADVQAWADQATGVRCRLVTQSQRAALSEFAEYPIITTYKLLVPASTDVQEGDRITDIALDSSTTDEGPYSVGAVLPRRSTRLHHISLELSRVGI